MQALHPEDVEDAALKARQAMTSGVSLENSFRIVRRDGEVRHISTSCVFYVTPDGQPRFLGADRDITEAWQREADLRAQSMRFEAAVENMGRGLGVYDGDGKLIVANKFYADIYGLPENLMVPGTSAEDIAGHIMSSGRLEAHIVATATKDALAVSEQSQPFDRTWRLANGRVIFYSTIPLETGGWVSIHRDITEQHLAEQQLAESEARFRDFTATASDWCWETDSEHRVTFLTEGFAASNGVELSRITDQNLHNLPVHGDDLPMMKRLLEVHDGTEQQPFKDVLLRMPISEDKLAYFLVSGLPKFDENGILHRLSWNGLGCDGI